MGTPLRQAHWIRDESIGLLDHTSATLLEVQADQVPDRLALIGNDHRGKNHRLTYHQVLAKTRAIAAALLERTCSGDHVALLSPNVVEWPLIEYAAAMTGRVLVALNPQAGIDELRYTLTKSEATMLLFGKTYRDRDLAAIIKTILPDCPSVRASHSLDTVARWATESFDPELEWPSVDPHTAAMLQYTSGTTGKQKGVLLAHRSMVNVARITMLTAGVEPGSIILSPFPQFHTAGCVTSNLGTLASGGTLILMDRWNPTEVLATVEREGVSAILLVPAMLHGLVQAAESGDVASRTIPTILVGAASVPSSLIEKAWNLFGGTVLNVYGQTELSAPLTATRRDDSSADITTTVGRPLPQVECRIADPVTGTTQEVDVPGEICARGYQQMLGYFRDPDATARTVDLDGWLHTGDLGSMDERGMITITGRLKELIIRGGENISPNEVSDCLSSHPAVAQAAVVGIPDQRLGEIVAAVVVCEADTDRHALREDLERHCARYLAKYKLPQRWYFTDTLPTTASGKIRALDVRQMILDGSPALRDGPQRPLSG
ncbi:class I adenylate-forming enzyme family protein [Rhodococcus sp. USK13]|uniref:class I adenylate-forming enzyme family protein n=1 Tax=Rhodococcus sp. USK13 TaxID=2806442 RepID=UPI002016C78C|nr:class I adenylate-forming enzyme family protein [Rhodococcus sp. USK13]